MTSRMAFNWMGVEPGDPAFTIGTNACDYFELGRRTAADYWLQGEMVGPMKEFVFNGRIFLPGGGSAGTVIDNFPKGPNPHGWSRRQRGDGQGYELVDSDGGVLFGYRLTAHRLCHVTVNIYARDGGSIAESLPDELRLHRGPAHIGRGGVFIRG